MATGDVAEMVPLKTKDPAITHEQVRPQLKTPPAATINNLFDDKDASKTKLQSTTNKCCHHSTFYLSSAWREMLKRKFNFGLGAASVLLVVVVAAVCFTVIAKTPVIFLQQAEAPQGQFDVQLQSEAFNYLNYTQLAINANSQRRFSYHSPRYELEGLAQSAACTDTIEDWGFDPMDPNWKYEGFADTDSDGCNNETMDCISVFCSTYLFSSTTLIVQDSEKEKEMGFGREWDYGTLGPGEVVIGKKLAASRGLGVGDLFYFKLDLETEQFLFNMAERGMIDVGAEYDNNHTSLLSAVMRKYGAEVYLPFTVKDVYEFPEGKFGDAKLEHIVTEYKEFIPLLVSQLHPRFRDTELNSLRSSIRGAKDDERYQNLTELTHSISDLILGSHDDLYSFAQLVYMNMPPERTDVYVRTTNYDDVQRDVIQFVADAMYFIGYPEVTPKLKVLEGMRDSMFFSLFLGLILSIILTILFVLSTMLLYSLLLISVETRTFEMGVHRMVGMATGDLVQLIMVQALSYAIPAWAIGLTLSQIFCSYILSTLEGQVHVPIDKALTGDAIAAATILGLLIPLIACILPIKIALSKNLHDTLDQKHSKTKAVKMKIERSESGKISAPWVVVGSGLTVFGFLIYYLLPLSLISFNLTLFANIFFGILLGMLFGLIMLSLNFEHMMERLVTFLFLWWEQKQMPILVLKNLVAHRVRNRKTTLMYALSIGFIIFINVSYRVEILTSQYENLKSHGAEMVVEREFWFIPEWAVSTLEQTCLNKDYVRDVAWVSAGINVEDYVFEKATMQNLGQYQQRSAHIYAVSPNFFEVAAAEFTLPVLENEDVGTSLGEQLYTVAGSQSTIFGTRMKDKFFLRDLTSDSQFLLSTQLNEEQIVAAADRGEAGGVVEEVDILRQHAFKPLAMLDSAPKFDGISRFSEEHFDFLVSFPTFLHMTQSSFSSIQNIPMTALLIDFVASVTDAQRDELKEDLVSYTATMNVKVFDIRDDAESLQDAETVMTYVFSTATYIAMGLCLFSLVASMYTNIYEQTKEIAILRAIGMEAQQIVKLYVYEAFVLTLSASLLGLFIGMVMAWTMTIQRALFTQLPIGFVFPWDFAILVCAGAGVCALIAAYAPSKALMRKSVASVMRTVL